MVVNLQRGSVLLLLILIFISKITAQTGAKENLFDEKNYTSEKSLKPDEKSEISPVKNKPFNYFNEDKSPENRTDKNTKEKREADYWLHQRGEKQWNVETGFSPLQPTFMSGRKEYDTDGRKFGLLSLRWGRVIGTAKGVTYEYQVEVAPVAAAFKNEVANPEYVDRQTTPNVAPTIRETTYGFAVMPAGFRFLFMPRKRLKPFIAAHAGFIFFKKPVPLPQSTSYDFIGDFGGGLQYQIKRDRALSFGYRYYHISNINIGEMNPGYNANVFYVGYSFFYK